VSYSLGIDIGGTFTDIVVYDHARGRQLNRKVLTTQDDPAHAVAAGVEGLLRQHRLPARDCNIRWPHLPHFIRPQKTPTSTSRATTISTPIGVDHEYHSTARQVYRDPSRLRGSGTRVNVMDRDIHESRT